LAGSGLRKKLYTAQLVLAEVLIQYQARRAEEQQKNEADMKEAETQCGQSFDKYTLLNGKRFEKAAY
jgi:hypothetical protein